MQTLQSSQLHSRPHSTAACHNNNAQCPCEACNCPCSCCLAVWSEHMIDCLPNKPLHFIASSGQLVQCIWVCFVAQHLRLGIMVQDTRGAATSLQRAAPQLSLLDRKRKLERVARMQQRWQRWEMSNFEYLMRVRTSCTPRQHKANWKNAWQGCCT